MLVSPRLWCLAPFLSHVANAASVHRSVMTAEKWRGELSVPSSYDAPRFRYWWPGGWIDPAVVKDEVEAIALAGFGSAEICDVRDSITVPMDPDVYGWGQARWNEGVLTAYQAAHENDVHIDLTLGPHWPTGVPGYTPDSVETATELVHGQFLLQPGNKYLGSLPVPVADPSGQTSGNPNVTATPQLIAVLAAKTSATSANASTIAIDHSTIMDISKSHKNGKLTWTAPHDGRYIVVAIYSRGTGQIQNMYDLNTSGPLLTSPSPAFIVDHLSVAGVEATTKYWDEHILTDELRSLMKDSQGSLFEDSLELKLTQYWTPKFIQEFKSRRRYDLTPYLLYVLKDTNTFTGDSDIARMVEYDFYSTVTDLYIDNRLTHLKKFAHSLGLKLRVQPYTATFDSSRAAAFVDIPEGESLGFESTPDSFRVLAAGRDVAGKTTILSNEIGAYQGKAYGVTWSFLLGTANYDASLGVSQNIIHGFPYSDSPTSLWPGFAPFTPLGTSSNGFADAWGPRQPQWLHARKASNYLARSQALLQSGSPSVDIAVLNLDWGITATWEDTGLNDAGYSYQFPTPELFTEYSASVKNRRLIYDGPRYKALVLNNVTALNVESAQQVLSWAKAGLPVVLVGSAPSQTQSLSTSRETRSRIASAFKSLLALKNTRQVSSEGEAPTALQSLGVEPLIRYTVSTNASTITTRRGVQDNEYIYWIYSSSRTSQTVYLEGEGFPLRLNLWTGEVSPIASFKTTNGYTAVNVTIGENSVEVIYLGRENPYGVKNLSRHIIATDGDGMTDEAGKVYVRATKNGEYSAQLSTDKSATVRFDSIPSPITPKTWTLTVEDWSPAIANTTGRDSSRTDKSTLEPITLNKLCSWHNISGLEYASGVGVYQTTVNLTLTEPKKGQSLGVYINFGDVEGSWDLNMNGKEVPGEDYFASAPLDVTSYVRDGENVIKITVATTLWNKLRKMWPGLYGTLDPEEIGLLGAVNFTYYAQEQVL
ncbi:hypothetical protein BJY01DRAFT_256192 [Aspergillus pseudoustus]|uniref:Glycosyl hydrolases family 2 sugar binding domain-containing protein n=1 Tax=Aspergillus pseudoustus TaxID=1810923 RepID=A0ABR4IFK1_9EURO